MKSCEGEITPVLYLVQRGYMRYQLCDSSQFVCSKMQKEVEAELDRLVGQEGGIHTKMLALQRMGYSQDHASQSQ